MKVLSLFSGIGAFEKALTNLEIPNELVGFSEIDKYAVKSYCAIHGVAEDMNLGDITKICEKALPNNIDLITYGFPCQDISIAGKQKGLLDCEVCKAVNKIPDNYVERLKGGEKFYCEKCGAELKTTRSGLFFEALRIIEATKPKIAIAENVKNLVGKKFNVQFRVVLDSLEYAGYNNYWKVLNAKDYGIPQNRERVFIVSIRKDIDTGTFQFPEPFPLTKRLKDVLEEKVDEKYYLSEKMITYLERLKAECATNGNGFGYQPTDGEGIAKTIQANAQVRSTDTLIQIGQMYPTSGNPQAGRIYDVNGISPTMDTCSGGNRMPKVAVAMRGRYNDSGKVEQQIEVSDREYANAITTVQKDSLIAEPQVLRQVRTEYGKEIRKAYESGAVDEKWGNMKQFEPRDDGISNTLSTVQKDNYVIEPVAYDEQNQYIRKDGCVGTIMTDGSSPKKNNRIVEMSEEEQPLRIRKLTPKECFRLMGFDDADFEKAEATNSNTQLYKQAGNSIVVPVVEYIIKALLDCGALEIKNKEKKEMELQIYSPSEDGFIKEISWNYEEIKREVAEKVSFYADLVYTDDQIKTAKEDRAKLRKFVDALETKRKEIKKQCLAPYEAFEAQMKEIVSIVNKPILMIDGQVKEYEESKKAERLEAIKEYFNTLPLILGFETLSLEKIFDPKWLNASTSMKSIEEAISNKCGQIVSDLATLAEMPEFGFEATDVYKDTLDINKAIAEGRRLSEMQKRKAEAERLKAEQEAARKAEDVEESPHGTGISGLYQNTYGARVAQGLEEPQTNTPDKQWVLFSALLSTEDAFALKDFFNSRNIEFKAVKR